MTPILQTTFFKHIFQDENVRISIQISLKFGAIDNKSALVQVEQATSYYLNQC